MIKVRNTETLDNQIVIRGKLILIKNTGAIDPFSNSINIDDNNFKPIIISNTEEIEVGDNRYSNVHKSIGTCINKEELEYLNRKRVLKHFFKILALPEHFSPKQLQAIVNGKIKDGDEVFVECIEMFPETEEEILIYEKDNFTLPFHIKLLNNHIKLFHVKQEESWDDIFEEYIKETFKMKDVFFNDWLKNNYKPPQKL